MKLKIHPNLLLLFKMEYLTPNGGQELPRVLRTLTIEYLGSLEVYRAYRWYLDLLGETGIPEDLRELSLMPTDKLLKYLDIFLTDGHRKVVDSLFEHHPEKDLNIWLLEAAYEGCSEMVKYLLARGASNLKGALKESARGGHQGIVEGLISQRTPWEIADALMGAAEGGHLRLVKHLIQTRSLSQYLNRALCQAAQKGHFKIAKYLIRVGCGVLTHFDFDMALLSAATGNQSEMVEYLISKGASKLDEALCNAVREGHLEMVKDLITWGAIDLDRALMVAAGKGHFKIVKYLIKQGAVNLEEALRSAAGGGHLRIVKYFIKLGATDLDKALRAAAGGGYFKVVDYLIKQGAAQLNGALSSAQSGKQTEMVRYLRTLGAM